MQIIYFAQNKSSAKKIKECIEPFTEYQRKMGVTEKSIQNEEIFLTILEQTIGEKMLEDLRYVDIAEIIEQGRMHGEYGAQRSIVTFRKLLKFIEQSEGRGSIPFDWQTVMVPKVPQKPVEYLTKEEIEELRAIIPAHYLAGVRVRAMMETLLDTGMRVGEMVSLNRDDIDWEAKEAKILNIKTKEWGKVYFTDHSLEWIKKYLAMRNDNIQPLFVMGIERRRIFTAEVRRQLRKYVAKSEIHKHISPHIFRRTFVTTLVQNNVDIKTVQTLARHKSERTTLRSYTGIDETRCKALHQQVLGAS